MNGIKKAKKFIWNEEIELNFIEVKKAFPRADFKHSQTSGLEISSS